MNDGGSVNDGDAAGGEAVFAMQCNRSTLDFDHEFERHRAALAVLLQNGAGNDRRNRPLETTTSG